MINEEIQAETSVTARELNRRMAAGQPAELLDVRTPVEFDAAHVPGAKLVPLDQLEPESFLRQRIQCDAPLYILCQSGGRARKAIEKFRRAGFNGCVLVEGGTQAWIEAGLPVNRGKTKVISLERQVRIVAGLLVLAGVLLGWFVHPGFFGLAAFVGGGLVFAGITDFCGMGLMLAKMPWNQRANCATASCCDAKH
jgi:rhodanese-related sulfurtransferase